MQKRSKGRPEKSDTENPDNRQTGNPCTARTATPRATSNPSAGRANGQQHQHVVSRTSSSRVCLGQERSWMTQSFGQAGRKSTHSPHEMQRSKDNNLTKEVVNLKINSFRGPHHLRQRNTTRQRQIRSNQGISKPKRCQRSPIFLGISYTAWVIHPRPSSYYK